MGKALIIADGNVADSLKDLLSAVGHEVRTTDDLTRGWTLASEPETDAVALGTGARGG